MVRHHHEEGRVVDYPAVDDDDLDFPGTTTASTSATTTTTTMMTPHHHSKKPSAVRGHSGPAFLSTTVGPPVADPTTHQVFSGNNTSTLLWLPKGKRLSTRKRGRSSPSPNSSSSSPNAAAAAAAAAASPRVSAVETATSSSAGGGPRLNRPHQAPGPLDHNSDLDWTAEPTNRFPDRYTTTSQSRRSRSSHSTIDSGPSTLSSPSSHSTTAMTRTTSSSAAFSSSISGRSNNNTSSRDDTTSTGTTSPNHGNMTGSSISSRSSRPRRNNRPDHDDPQEDSDDPGEEPRPRRQPRALRWSSRDDTTISDSYTTGSGPTTMTSRTTTALPPLPPPNDLHPWPLSNASSTAPDHAHSTMGGTTSSSTGSSFSSTATITATMTFTNITTALSDPGQRGDVASSQELTDAIFFRARSIVSTTARTKAQRRHLKQQQEEVAARRQQDEQVSDLPALLEKDPIADEFGSSQEFVNVMQQSRAMASSPPSQPVVPREALEVLPTFKPRRVRFTVEGGGDLAGGEAILESQDSTLSALSAASTNSESSGSSPKPPATTSRRKPPRLRSGSSSLLDDLEEVDKDHISGPKFARKPKARTVVSPPAIVPRRGVTRDIGHVEDDGNHQMIHDEIAFLCSTLLSSALSSSSSTTSTMANLSAASELCQLLSIRKNRQVLFFTTHGGENSLQLLRQGENSVLGELLKVLGHVPIFLKTCDDDDHGSADLDQSRTIQEQCRRHLVGAFSIILYFLSLDCTLSGNSACKSAFAAKRIREVFLTHGEAMRGILYVILADPLSERWVGRPSLAIRQHRSPTNGRKLDHEDESVASSVAASSDVSESPWSVSSSDPTVTGRRRVKKRRLGTTTQTSSLQPVPEKDNQDQVPADGVGCDLDSLSFAPSSPVPGKKEQNANRSVATAEVEMMKASERLDTVTIRVLEGVWQHSTKKSPCSVHDDSQLALVGLVALKRIITGRDLDNEKSCIDDNEDDLASFKVDTDSARHHMVESYDEEDMDNPLIATNRLLQQAGTIPLLAQALADTLSAFVHILKQARKSTNQPCASCLSVMQERLSILGSVVDGACLLNDDNRRAFCESGFMAASGGFLIIDLVFTLNVLLDQSKLFEGSWGELSIECLRTLTSLSHDNEIASKELTNSLRSLKGKSTTISNKSGLSILALVLYEALSAENGDAAKSKVKYDASIFCLNTLTNAIESGAGRHLLEELNVPSSQTAFLSWLTRRLVEETDSFRDALVESHFGSSPSKHDGRELSEKEGERLVIAGNGFILLSYLLISDYRESTNGDVLGRLRSCRELIWEEIPGDNTEARVAFLRNALKAFCNFYHFSVGDLSLAVVAPVKLLISQLDAIVWKQPT